MGINKEQAAKLMGVSVSYFVKKYSSRLKKVSLGKCKLYNKEQVQDLKNQLIEQKRNL